MEHSVLVERMRLAGTVLALLEGIDLQTLEGARTVTVAYERLARQIQQPCPPFDELYAHGW